MTEDIKQSSNSNSVVPNKLKQKLLKVPLAEVGKWFHKKWNTINFTPEYFEKAITNYKNNVLKHTPYLTYGHLKEPFSVDSERRRGELLNLVFEDRYLFGIFDATDEAYNFVKNREYLYASVEMIPNFIDKDTGKDVGPVVLRAALTNSPFLPASKEVVALSVELGFNSEDTCILSVHQAKQLMSEVTNNTESPTVRDESVHKDEETIVESTVSMSQENQSIETFEPTKSDRVNVIEESTIDTPIEEPMTTTVQSIQMEPSNKPVVEAPATVTPVNSEVNTNISNLILPKEALTQHVQNLTESIKTKVATKYEAQLASYAQTVEALKAQLSQVEQQLSGKEQKAKAYELSIHQATEEISRANRQLIIDHMLGQGVPPVIATKFNEVSDAYLNKQSTVKLSIGGSEPEERTLLDAFAELIISASNTPPINLSQNGSPYSKPYDPTGRTQFLSKIIERNYEISRAEMSK
ncbi:MAG: hypothetical protein ACKPFF_36750 [Planktothrix sp.]